MKQQKLGSAGLGSAAKRVGLAAVVWAVVGASSLWAQTSTASLTGQVQDSTGAAVSGATVTISEPARGFKMTATSDANGNYTFPQLAPDDHYEIRVERQGFKTETQTNVSLQVAQAAKIDLKLSVGAASESVTVSAEAPQLDTQSSSLGQVITGQTVQDLPLNGRSTFRLIALTPGVTFSQAAFGQFGDVAVNSTFDTDFSINGGRAQSNEILIDGVPSSAGFFDQITTLPVVDETQEFKVQSSNLSAQYGRYAGGVINVTTMGGTNVLHGDVYEFARNSVFDANEWFNKQAGQPNVPFSMNQFGGTVGGPVRIPKLYNGRDKTFFFFSYQGTRRTRGAATTFSVPTAAERSGDFSALTTKIYNPFQSNLAAATGANIRPQFAYNNVANTIDPALFDPVAVAMTKYIPLPNTGPAGATTNNFISNAPLGVTQDIFSGRIDQNVTQKYHLQGRYAHSSTPLAQPDTYHNVATTGSGAVGVTTFKTQSFALNNIFQLTNNLVLNVNYGFARWYQSRQTRSYGFDNLSLGFPQSFVNNITIPMFPGVSIGGGYSGLATQSYLSNGNDSHAVLISASWLKGKQTINFGVDGRVHRINFFNVGNSAGQYSFAVAQTQAYVETGTPAKPVYTATAKTGDGFASFLIGAGSSGSFPIGSGVELQDVYGAVYVQDDIRLTEKLTVNLGVRYDGESPYTDRHNELNYFDPNVPSPAKNASFPNLTGGLSFAGQSGNQGAVYTVQHNNVAPRLGFAWSPYNTTTFRGGWGISYAPLETSDNAVGFSPSLGFASTTNWNVSNDGYTPANLLRNPYPQGVIRPTGPTLGAGTQLGQSLSVWSHNTKNPLSMQWNLDMEQQFPGGFLFDAGYSGSRGEHLTSDFDDNALNPALAAQYQGGLNTLVPNPFQPFVSVGTLSAATVAQRQLLLPYPQFGSIVEVNKGWGDSYYHSAQIKGVKRESHGIQFLAAFTWSKLISDVNAQNAGIGTTNDSSTQNYYCLRCERSISELNQAFNFVFNTSWELPFGRGRAYAANIGPGLDKLIGGWKLSGIWTEQSGAPLTFTSTGVGVGSRPDLVLGVVPRITGKRNNLDITGSSISSGTCATNPGKCFFNANAFKAPQSYTEGTVPRAYGAILGPGLQNFDATLQKDIPFGNRYRAELRMEMFNVTNTPHFSNPVTAVQNTNFGKITSTVASPPEREIQFAGKFYF